MFSIFDAATDRISAGRVPRRELVRVGGLRLLGLSSLDLARLRAAAQAQTDQRPRAGSCIFIFLFGGSY